MTNANNLLCFKAYDIRGRLGDEINEGIAYRIGCATAESLKAQTVVLGFDARETSASLAQAVANGICDSGADVLDIGLSGTEEIYAAVPAFNADAGIEITASHNPIDYNGMKIVKQRSQPLSDQEFLNIKYLAEEIDFVRAKRSGSIVNIASEAREAYVEKVLGFINLKNLKPLKIVLNSGNGAAGPVVDLIRDKLNLRGIDTNFVYVHHTPDPLFPNGIPNPLLEENRSKTADVVVKERADFGVAFDGDFDRCFLFDHEGNFVSGEYVVGLLSQVFLSKEPGAKVVHDPRAIWNTVDIISECNGQAIQAKTGHAFVKAAMRKNKAIYGGEISAHHYFRDFAYCDSGMIPWLIVWQLLSERNSTLYDLISDRKALFPSSGELNFTITDAAGCLKRLKEKLAFDAKLVEELDGLSMSFIDWRFNLRPSNTEPLVRLNIETRGDQSLLDQKIRELKGFINQDSI